MNRQKYVALDVDSANIVAGVFDSKGDQIMECFLRTRSSDIREFFQGIGGTIKVAFEEGTQAAWLYDLIRPLVAEVTVCNPRRNKLLAAGNKADRIDVKKLGTLLRLGELEGVYHGERTTQGLKHLVRGYENLVADTTRTMNRLKAMFRGRGIGCRGSEVYGSEDRRQWVEKLEIDGLEKRADYLYAELDCLMRLRSEAKKAMCSSARKHPAYKLVCQVPGVGPVRTAQIIAVVGSPHRFRTKRQFWPYCGLAVVTRSSGDYEWVDGRPQRRKKPVQTRGLNKDFNRSLKTVFKGAAVSAINKDEPFRQYYQRMIDNGTRPEMALVTVARKIAAITLAVWKKGEKFDPERLNQATRSGDQ